MQVTIFGANGKVGSEVVKYILDKRQDSVVVFVHKHSAFVSGPRLKIVKGDIHSKQDVLNAVEGSDIIVSCLGSWGTKTKDILTVGMANIVEAMTNNHIKRLISLTGTDAVASGDQKSLFSSLTHALIKVSPARKILIDGENHIKIIEASNLDWTILRSPIMNTKGSDKAYTLSLVHPMPWSTVNRNSVALSIIKLLDDTAYLHQAPFITREQS